MPQTPQTTPDPVGFDPIAGLLALLFPGAGHFVRAHRQRGICIAVGVLGMFVGGLLIGGLSVVDRRSDRLETGLSFIGQAFVGPLAFVVDGIHQSQFKGRDPATGRRREVLRGERIQDGVIVAAPGAEPPMQRSLGKVNEIGVLYCLIAGMVNFIACLDALFPTFRTRRDAPPAGAGAIDAVLARSGGAS